MNFFQKQTCWTNNELAIFKIAVAAFALLLGAYFQEYVMQFKYILVIIFIFSGMITGLRWYKKMQANN